MTVLRLDVELPYPVELVWRAMTDRRLLAEWFLHTDLLPVPGGVYRAFPTPDIPGFTAPFDMDVVEVVSPTRLALRWRGEQLHSDVVWELSTIAAGCRMRISQTGFLGIAGEERRAELQRAYALMFAQRLPALLARLDAEQSPPARRRRSRDVYDAADMPRRPPAVATAPAPAAPPETAPEQAALPDEAPPVPTAAAGTPRDGLLRSVYAMPVERRLRLLSVAGAMVITVLLVTAVTTLLLRTPGPAAEAAGSGRGPGSGVQAADPAKPAASGAPAQSPAPTPSPATAPPRSASAAPSPSAADDTRPAAPSALSVSYRTTEAFTGGFIGEITVRPGAGGLAGWTATLDLPADAQVTSAWDRIDFRQDGTRVTFTPQQVHRNLPAARDFSFAFQVGDPSGATRPDACAVNSTPCS